MIDLHLQEIVRLTLIVLYGLLTVVTWRASVLWNGLARSLTAASAALSLSSAYFLVLSIWPWLDNEAVVGVVRLLLIATGIAAIYYIQRETRRATGGYKIAQEKEVVQQSLATARLADETQRVADETQRVADAAEVLNAASPLDVINTAAEAAVVLLSTAAAKAADVLSTAAAEALRVSETEDKEGKS